MRKPVTGLSDEFDLGNSNAGREHGGNQLVDSALWLEEAFDPRTVWESEDPAVSRQEGVELPPGPHCAYMVAGNS